MSPFRERGGNRAIKTAYRQGMLAQNSTTNNFLPVGFSQAGSILEHTIMDIQLATRRVL